MWLALGMTMVGFAGFFAMYSYIAPTLTVAVGLAPSVIPFVVGLYGLGMVLGNVLGGKLADYSVMRGIIATLGLIAVVLFGFSLSLHSAWSATPMVFVVGLSSGMLAPILQTRLLDVSPDAQTLAASLSHSAFNVANALGAFLGGAVIGAGFGFGAPAVVGGVLAIGGIVVALVSQNLDRMHNRELPRSATHHESFDADLARTATAPLGKATT